jgi:uncharacterized protein YjeT (DUF2065 family)
VTITLDLSPIGVIVGNIHSLEQLGIFLYPNNWRKRHGLTMRRKSR